MTSIAIKDLLEAGVHFGHQTKRWNPKMKPYIFGARNGIYIIDLGRTAELFAEAETFVRDLAAEGKTVLFVGTKRQAQDLVVEEARRCGMFFVNQRWLGGLLTNFVTIQRSIARLRDMEAMAEDGRYDTFSKKEIARIEKEKRKLHKNLDGIRHMSRLPDAVFVVDTRKEKIAVDEARKLKIPVIGIVDTNCNPDDVDYVIPGNDDALRSIRLFLTRIADAAIAGRDRRESSQSAPAGSSPTTGAAPPPAADAPAPAASPASAGESAAGHPGAPRGPGSLHRGTGTDSCKDGDGNHLAACEAQESPRHGLSLRTGGDLLSITVLPGRVGRQAETAGDDLAGRDRAAAFATGRRRPPEASTPGTERPPSRQADQERAGGLRENRHPRNGGDRGREPRGRRTGRRRPPDATMPAHRAEPARQVHPSREVD